jgi:hypothetical protein
MLYSEIIPDLKVLHISKIEKGNIIVNLGLVIEIEKLDRHYSIIISRLNEKQVMKFDMEIFMVIM